MTELRFSEFESLKLKSLFEFYQHMTLNSVSGSGMRPGSLIVPSGMSFFPVRLWAQLPRQLSEKSSMIMQRSVCALSPITVVPSSLMVLVTPLQYWSICPLPPHNTEMRQLCRSLRSIPHGSGSEQMMMKKPVILEYMANMKIYSVICFGYLLLSKKFSYILWLKWTTIL